MSENKKSEISKAQTLEEIGDFWDSNSLADHWDETEEVQVEVRAKQRRRITISPQIYEKLKDQARLEGVLPETLINVWLSERLEKAK
jgi:hypothetical protein